jgi:hypothetical protein
MRKGRRRRKKKKREKRRTTTHSKQHALPHRSRTLRKVRFCSGGSVNDKAADANPEVAVMMGAGAVRDSGTTKSRAESSESFLGRGRESGSGRVGTRLNLFAAFSSA